MFGPSQIHSSADARRLARRRLPWMVFDYIDGAAGEGSAERQNLAALRDMRFIRTESRAGADWPYLERLRAHWQGNLVVKGVTSVEDAVRLKAVGADAIQVSTHGGRQLDSAPSPILCLQRIRQELGDKYPLFYDTGLRSGEDVVKA